MGEEWVARWRRAKVSRLKKRPGKKLRLPRRDAAQRELHEARVTLAQRLEREEAEAARRIFSVGKNRECDDV